jgi:hypothetical protein
MGNEKTTRECPYCKEEIKAEAIKCKHCRSNVSPEKPAHEGICPYCKEEIKPNAIKCKHCGSMLNSSSESDCEGCSEKSALGQFTSGIADIDRFPDFEPPQRYYNCSACHLVPFGNRLRWMKWCCSDNYPISNRISCYWKKCNPSEDFERWAG